MRVLKILPLLAALTFASPANCEPETHIGVSATTASATINKVPAGRRFIALPELEYEFAIDLQCAPQMQAESISISIADTRRTFAANEIAGQSRVSARIAIPRQQVSPLAINGFCQVADEQETPTEQLIVEDAFTAHVSLLCAQDERRSILYAVQALDLNLRCTNPEAHAMPTDQGVSVEPPSAIER